MGFQRRELLFRLMSIGFCVLGLGAPSLAGAPDPANSTLTLRDPPPSLSPKASLGKALFFDTTLSTPVGQSCGSCHSVTTGFTFPDSNINQQFGVAPGVIPGRFGNRHVPQVSYAAYISPGPPHFSRQLKAYVGGLFWDGRATDLANQATFPFQNPNEMNNLTHNLGDPSLVVQKVSQGSSAALFQQVYGSSVFSQPTSTVFADIADAIAEYEKTPEVSPFSSKYDAWLAGLTQLTDAEMDGLRIFTGSWTGGPGGGTFPKFAQCVFCHGISADASTGRDLWTNTCYANIGVPRNAGNPFYTQTDSSSNPAGYNPLGQNFVDIGLGNFLYPLMGLPAGNAGDGSDGKGDYLGINGTFEAPSLRNVDRRPSPGFIKAYMHNGSLKSLKDVVHFYNTRNLTTAPGEVIDFTLDDPYANLVGKPLWPAPEYPSPDTLQNPGGIPGNNALSGVTFGESDAQVGNLVLSDQDEDHIVAFMQTLSDGFFDPAQAFTDPCNSFIAQPIPQNVCRTGLAMFTVATLGTGTLTYQWMHGDPPSPIQGATNAVYWIGNAAVSAGGTYRCAVTSSCGTIVSKPATLRVCVADFDCSGSVTVSDIFSYLDAWFSITLADLNGDGRITPTDIFQFLSAWFVRC